MKNQKNNNKPQGHALNFPQMFVATIIYILGTLADYINEIFYRIDPAMFPLPILHLIENQIPFSRNTTPQEEEFSNSDRRINDHLQGDELPQDNNIITTDLPSSPQSLEETISTPSPILGGISSNDDNTI